MVDYIKKITEYLESRYPNSQIKFIGAGWDSWAFMIDDNIARFSKLKSPTYDFEKKVLDYIRDKVPVQIPDISVINDGGYCFSIHKSLDGNQWNFRDAMENWPDDKQDNLIHDFADFLVALHSIDARKMMREIPELKYFDYTPYEPEYLWNIFKEFVSRPEFDAFYKKYVTLCGENKIASPVLLHMDFGGHNCLADERGHICSVIDFNGARVGPHDMDIMRECGSGKFFDAVRAIYESKTGQLIDIERGRNDRFIEYVHAIVRLFESNNDAEMKNKNIKSFADGYLKFKKD